MAANRKPGWLAPAFLLTACALLAPADSRAQAWVPAPGQGSVSLGYQYTSIDYHLFSQNIDVDGDNRVDLGKIRGKTLELSASYGILPGLAANGTVAYVTSRYQGIFPEGALDDGRYHGDLQDVMVGLRYMVQWQGLAITPSVDVRIPTGNYDSFGHVAVGRGLNEVSTGIAVGRSLSPLLPAAFASVHYERAFIENHHEHDLDRNRLGVAAGYLINRSLSVGGSLQHVDTVDGIDWVEITTEQEFHIHDVAAKEKFLRAGGFVSLALSRRFGVTISYQHTLSGENSHDARSLTVSPSWNFSTPLHW